MPREELGYRGYRLQKLQKRYLREVAERER
jgi:membrane protease YdiL (CAAX protease family)